MKKIYVALQGEQERFIGVFETKEVAEQSLAIENPDYKETIKIEESSIQSRVGHPFNSIKGLNFYIIVEKETGRFVSAHKSEYDAVKFYCEYLSELPAEYDIQQAYTL